jgi:stage V sporulation protein S
VTDIIRVSANSLTTAVAGAIAGVIRDRGQADVQAIGASAVNQAVKAIAIARGYLKEDGLVIACVPYFVEVRIGENDRTAIRLTVTTTDALDAAMLTAETVTTKAAASGSDNLEIAERKDTDLQASNSSEFARKAVAQAS